MARPTDYSEEILEQAKYYIQNYNDDGIGDVIPSIEGLAVFLGVSRETIYDWESQEEKSEFSDIVKQLRTKKSRELQNKGLDNKYNASIAKLLLGHEGYRDKQDIDHTTKGEQINDLSQVEKIAQEVASKLRNANTNG